MTAKAGDIVFDITGDDSKLRQTLGSAANNAMRAGQAIGAAMTAAGAVITGFAVSSVRDYAAAGDEVHKMSERTGFATESLSELRHMAGLSGAELGNVEKASKTLSKVITEAEQGTQSYVDALGAVGLSYDDLAGLSPEEQFYEVAYALADVQDKTTQVAAAQELWGSRAGTQLLPMLANGRAGMEAMAAEAHRLGIVFDQEGANKAALYNDEMQRLGSSFMSFKYDVAEALIPTLISLMQWVTETMVAFREWRDENGPLADAIIRVSAAIGAAMVVLGPLLVMLPGIVLAVKGVIAVFGVLAVAVTGPVGIVVAAVAALGVAAYGIYKEWDWVKGLLIGVWESIASAFELIFAPIIWAWEKVQGMAMDAKIQVQQARSQAAAQSAAATAPGMGGQAAAATQGPSATGGGFFGSGNITINVNGAGDPSAVSRMVADALRGELRARGFAT